jgi:hypothetical protein
MTVLRFIFALLGEGKKFVDRTNPPFTLGTHKDSTESSPCQVPTLKHFILNE